MNNTVNTFKPKRIGETRRRKVSKLGTVSLGVIFAGQHVFIKDNLDGTFTVFTGAR